MPVSASAASAELSASRRLVAEQNRKRGKSGGFQSMGLSKPIFSGVIRKGYRVPTPIQRKTVPHILAGRDLVAMARTGSGKTAAFLIPVLERLRVHECGGARALVLSPTRELALQTLDFCKALGKFTDLHVAIVLGGDSMDNQFTALHSNPDIIVASPGRLLHLLTEMEAKLSRVQMLVLDECDRLFELGFQEQISLLLSRLPAQRQTLLFSATLPERVAEFARAGLSDPLLVRLDVDTKLSKLLRMSFLTCRDEDKVSVLLHLLHTALRDQQLTLVFLATKHHVEWLYQLLSRDSSLSVTYLYSSMDPTARRLHGAQFRSGEKRTLLTTDLAARGLDLPQLNHVVNFHSPAKEKLFVHRVGRVARAGKSGTAVSLVSPDEMPYLYDLELFLGARKLRFLDSSLPADASTTTTTLETDDCVGAVPADVFEQFADWCRSAHEASADLEAQRRCAEKAFGQYLRSRPQASREAVKKWKAAQRSGRRLLPHPMFKDYDRGQESVLAKLKAFKARTTIFESKHATPQVTAVMQRFRQKTRKAVAKAAAAQKQSSGQDGGGDGGGGGSSACDWVSSALSGGSSGRQSGFIAYARDAAEAATERGLALDLQQHSLDVMGDEVGAMLRRKTWDRKKKKFVGADAGSVDSKKVMIRNESGQLVPASYKTDRYAKWRKRNPQHGDASANNEGGVDGDSDADGEDVNNGEGSRRGGGGGGLQILGCQRKRRGAPLAAGGGGGGPPGAKSERKSHEQIVKARRVRERNRAKNQKRAKKPKRRR